MTDPLAAETPAPSPGGTSSPGAAAFEQAAYRKVAWRILPLLIICYFSAYLDRVNIGFARLQMVTDLKFSETVYGFGAGVFFIGYFIFEVPSNLILHRLGARLWIGRIMISWGLVSGSFVFVRTPVMFYALRFLLGVAEAGFYPGVILYLTYWYPSGWRARMTSAFMTAIPASGILGGPLSGWIMASLSGVRGLAGWQWLFVIEAIPALLLGVVVILFLDNNIRSAKWLTEDEKRMLERNIAAESGLHEHPSILVILRDRRVWLMCLSYFSCAMGQYGLTFWMPTLIENAGVSGVLQIGMLTAVPYTAAIIAMVVLGRTSDRTRARRWHEAGALLGGAVGLILSTTAGTHTTFALVCLTVAAMGILPAAPLFWNLPTAILSGSAAAAGIAAINAIANLGGFVSPYVVGGLRDLTDSTAAGLLAVSAVLVAGAIAALRLSGELVDR